MINRDIRPWRELRRQVLPAGTSLKSFHSRHPKMLLLWKSGTVALLFFYMKIPAVAGARIFIFCYGQLQPIIMVCPWQLYENPRGCGFSNFHLLLWAASANYHGLPMAVYMKHKPGWRLQLTYRFCFTAQNLF